MGGAEQRPLLSGLLYVCRCDGPLLGALKAGLWVLLDELNLASQSVLEGLNALLDHRAEVSGAVLARPFPEPTLAQSF